MRSRSRASSPADFAFRDIVRLVDEALQSCEFAVPHSIDEVLEIDRATRSSVAALMKESCP